jgi:hypothetical protein
MKKIYISLSVVLAVAALPADGRAVVTTNARVPALVPFGAALSPVPVIQAPVMTPGLTAGALSAPSLLPMTAPALTPIPVAALPAPVVANASPLTQTAVGVAAAIEAVGDLSRAGSSDVREHGKTLQALLNGEMSAPSVSVDLSAPAAARVPARTLFDRIAEVKLDRYTAALVPWLGVPGYYHIAVTGPEGAWDSYGVLGTNLGLGKDQEVSLFVAKLELALNARKIKLSDLKDLKDSYNWPTDLDSPRYAKINAMKLTAHRVTLQPWSPMPGFHQLAVTGPNGAWDAYSVYGDQLASGKDREVALFAAKLERALDAGKVSAGDIKRLQSRHDWLENLGSPENERINAMSLSRYKASLIPWPSVPGHYKIMITGPSGSWESYGLVGRNYTTEQGRALALFVAKLERALNTGVLTMKNIEWLQTNYEWPTDAINAIKTAASKEK